ncbi:MAG: carboxypeptidase-like regulatory domain-containing protein [Bacteroidales bacterium]|jgi:hypothetical protein|nr:carboxypeptidase-like regulatory domain-containing protein [Bacteroidales bacterium]
MKRGIIFITFILLAMSAFSQRMATIKGRVTDFSGKPIAGALIEVKTNNFDMKYHAYSDVTGNYSVQVEPGTYLGIAAVRMQEYAKSKLEFWAWNVPAYNDMTINMRYDRLEVYGLNVFRIHGSYRGYTIYCRPMSLSKYLEWEKDPNVVMDLAPAPDKIKIDVTVNGYPVRVNMVDRVQEFAGDNHCSGYMIYTDLGTTTTKLYDEIRVTITDLETGEQGEAVYYKTKDNFVN